MLRALCANWELKLVSLAIAIALWFFVISHDQSQVALAAPLEYVGLGVENALMLVGEYPDRVDVQVQGARWVVSRLSPDQLRVRVDLAGVPEGESVLQLTPDQVLVPAGVSVGRITPGWVRVTLVSGTTATLRVVPQVRGAPAEGYVVERVVASPPTVRVSGPRTTVEGRTTVETVPVEITGQQETVTRTVGLVLPAAAQVAGHPAVEVTVEIRAEPGRRERREG
jgi:YbbR domain-containing protein